MSVTISIVNNVQHCERKHLVEKHVHECTCVCDQQADPKCWICKGTGEWEESIYPFEINLANRNFIVLWKAIGLKIDCSDFSGQLDGRVLRRAIKTIDVEAVVRKPEIDDNFMDFGISRSQVDNYIEQLTRIALEAERRESNVCWG
jgi:hypothetical protein